MNVLPIIARELRTEARWPVNYRLRMFSACVALVILGTFLCSESDARSGGRAFSSLTFGIFRAIWIWVPAFTADCISREKREGTLGLLVMTSLKPIEIVLSKGVIYAVRSLTFIAAVVPIVTIPVALGGVTPTDLFWTFLFNLAALGFVLAAGLLASSFCQHWTRAILLAEIFATAFALLFLVAIQLFFSGPFSGMPSFTATLSLLSAFFFSNTNLQRIPVTIGVADIVWFAIGILALSLIVLGISAIGAAFRVKTSWRDDPPSGKLRWIQETFCRPRVAPNWLRQQNRARLTRNPVGWLQQYSWTARMSKWAWCFALVLGILLLKTSGAPSMGPGVYWLGIGLLLSIAFSAVASFQREKPNGALELLLVTSLGEKQIILGRLSGIWGQFWPAYLILLLTTVFVGLGQPFNLLLDFFFVPVVGLFFALHVNNFAVAWMLTAILTLFIPSFFFGFSQALLLSFITSLTAILLYFEMKDRTFALARV